MPRVSRLWAQTTEFILQTKKAEQFNAPPFYLLIQVRSQLVSSLFAISS